MSIMGMTNPNRIYNTNGEENWFFLHFLIPVPLIYFQNHMFLVQLSTNFIKFINDT